MSFEFFLSMRHIRAKKQNSLISAIPFLTIAGIMIGIMALIVVLSVMNGLKEEFLSTILGVQSHVTMTGSRLNYDEQQKVLQEIKSVEGVIDASPSIYRDTIINKRAYGALRGVDPDSISRIIEIEPMIKEGDISSLKTAPGDMPAIILGSDLAAKLGVELGDPVRLMASNARVTPIGMSPNYGSFIVTGIIKSGSADIDLFLAVAALKDVQKLYNMEDRITNFEIRVFDADKSELISQRIRKKTDFKYSVMDWKSRNENILTLLQLDKYGQFIICLMIVLVGALNIISALIMTVMDKSRDIAILRTMGAAKKSIMTVFMIEGLFAGVVGTIAGVCSGLGICYIIANYKFSLPTGLYPMASIPIQVESFDVVVVVFSGLLLAFLATLYPSWRASTLNPIETLRYE